VQSIIRELRGEKIDIVDGATTDDFRAERLSPARSAGLDRDEEQKIMEVCRRQAAQPRDRQEGQNVRSPQIVGWRIDIKSEEEKRREVEAEMPAWLASSTRSAARPHGLGERTVQKLVEAGVAGSRPGRDGTRS